MYFFIDEMHFFKQNLTFKYNLGYRDLIERYHNSLINKALNKYMNLALDSA